MSNLWIPKKRRKCPHTAVCGWIDYSDSTKCPMCGSTTTEAEAYDPGQNWDTAMPVAKGRNKYFTVGIDLKGK